MLGNRSLSVDVFRKYVSIYKCATDEEKAHVERRVLLRGFWLRTVQSHQRYLAKVKALLLGAA
jgi:hypothetical protein